MKRHIKILPPPEPYVLMDGKDILSIHAMTPDGKEHKFWNIRVDFCACIANFWEPGHTVGLSLEVDEDTLKCINTIFNYFCQGVNEFKKNTKEKEESESMNIHTKIKILNLNCIHMRAAIDRLWYYHDNAETAMRPCMGIMVKYVRSKDADRRMEWTIGNLTKGIAEKEAQLLQLRKLLPKVY